MRTSVVAAVTAALALVLVTPVRASQIPFELQMVSARGTPIRNLTVAEAVLAGQVPNTVSMDVNCWVIRFADQAHLGLGPFGHNRAFPGKAGFNEQNFAAQTTAFVAIPTAGNYSFGVRSDDGFRLQVGDFVSEVQHRRGPRETMAVFDFTHPGIYPLELTYFQRLDRAEVELYAAQGAFTHFRRHAGFHLVGDVSKGGLQLVSAATSPVVEGSPPPLVGEGVPEPSGCVLLIVPAAGLLLRRRRGSESGNRSGALRANGIDSGSGLSRGLHHLEREPGDVVRCTGAI